MGPYRDGKGGPPELIEVQLSNVNTMSLYLNTLAGSLSVLGINQAVIQAATIRARFYYCKPSQKCDAEDYPLKKVFKAMFLVFDDKKFSEKEKDENIKVYADIQRNFLENIVPFSMVAFGTALFSSKLSAAEVARARWAVPYRALMFVPQMLATGYLSAQLLQIAYKANKQQ